MLNYLMIFLNVIIILFFILIAGILPLIERKYLSLMQRRIGPKYVGYNGRLQFLADALKILFKELIYLYNINKIFLILLPLFLFNLNIILLCNIIWFKNIYIISLNYFLFFVLLIELINRFFYIIIAFNVKNKYTNIAGLRIINGTIVYEIFLTIFFLIFVFLFSNNSIYAFNNNYIFYYKIITYFFLVIMYISVFLINLNKVPYDLIEAETEIIMGYTVEHSGFLFGSLLMIEYLHLIFWTFIFCYLILCQKII